MVIAFEPPRAGSLGDEFDGTQARSSSSRLRVMAARWLDLIVDHFNFTGEMSGGCRASLMTATPWRAVHLIDAAGAARQNVTTSRGNESS